MISGVILAAGTSSRMGKVKQLLPYKGLPLLQHVLDRTTEAALDEIVVVLGHAAEEIRQAIRLPDHARFVWNDKYRTGQASSLRVGLESVSGQAEAAVILLGDQPDLPSDAIRAVLRVYAETSGLVVRAEYRGRPGHPVLLARSIWEAVSQASGDRGAGPALTRHPEWIVSADVDLPPPAEVDTPDDFRLLSQWEGEPT